MTAKRQLIIIAVVGAGVAFVIGLLIGLYAPAKQDPNPDPNPDPAFSKLTRDADPSVSQPLINEINADNIDTNLKKLTERPHIAGRSEDDDTYRFVRDQWTEQGYDVETVTYQVLLSYPEENHNNTAQLLTSGGSVLHTTSAREHAYYKEETHLEAVQPFNAFSPSGTVEAELVYAHYARDVDFEKLKELNINVTGKIVIARYGSIFRGNKVYNAHLYGAVGIILFMDPKDYTAGNKRYPDTIWLPPTGVQRGNIVLVKGDQATPGYPAKWYTVRLTQDELEAKLPKIPCHPIGYGDAYYLLREMGGASVPGDWQGGLNFTYRLGGSMNDNKKVRLEVKNKLETVTIKNIFAKIKGSIESDKVVLIGNHRDAWVYGGADPSSGTATLLEMSRSYAKQVKKGWKPRRTILFCSWDAEEYGLVGSYEWVEENIKWLQNRAVAYLNIDTVTSGNYTLSSSATPTLRQALFRASKKVPDPHQTGKTLFDVWAERSPDAKRPGYPEVPLPGGGSDFVPFEQDVALPTCSTKYSDFELGDEIRRGTYPLYHTLYESYHYSKMIDPGFKYSKALGSYILEVVRDLVDSPILPFDTREYAQAIAGFVDGLFSSNQQSFARWNVTRDGVQSAADNFTSAADKFHEAIDKMDKQNPILLREVNEKLMTLEKAFQIHTGIPNRPEFKHVLLSPSRANYYSTTTFPGMADLLYQIGDDVRRWHMVRKHLSEITFCIQSAAKILME